MTAQNPAPGTQVAPSERVRVTVSASTTPTMQSVPRVIADDERTAAAALRQAGFVPVVIRRKLPGGYQRGVAIEQQPEFGQKAPRGGSVAIYVASNRK